MIRHIATFAKSGSPARMTDSAPTIYVDTDDRWIGHYKGPNHHYLCLLPMLVLRWNRR
jgi:hypothetical protein